MIHTMYIGGYGQESLHRVALQDGRLGRLDSFPAVNASYLCFSADRKRLYAVGETQRFRGEIGGSIQSYDISADGRLTQTSIRATRGMDPCHLTILGNLLVVTNYSSGSISRFLLNDDGTIGEMLPLMELTGSGPKADRQECPHPHQAQRTPGGWLAVSDLGADRILFYAAAELTQPQPEALSVPAPTGFGPRHCVFPKGRDTWYVLCELESQLLVYRGTPGNAHLIGRVSIGDGAATNYPAALRLSPDGQLLAASGRGQNVIALFSIGENGLLSRLTEISCEGDWPRDVQFSPDGKYLVCANQRSDRLSAFAVGEGRLESCGSVRIPAPACILFASQED